jgi:uncharacterized membrane protein YdbT with pleckstrin-like domain
MDFEMKFLTAFYAVLSVVVSVACVAILLQNEMLGMLVVVLALFAAIGVLGMNLLGSDREDDHDVKHA